MAASKTSISRRSFLKTSAMAGGGLMISFGWMQSVAQAGVASINASHDFTVINGFLKIASNGVITIMLLLYSSDLQIEGLIYASSGFHWKEDGKGTNWSVPILYEKAIQVTKQQNADYVWLGVWEENPRAIHFYKKNGFVESDKHIFKLGDDKQTDIMMKFPLKGEE